jgi:hypothetical protein
MSVNNTPLIYSEHTCVTHDKKFPDNPMNCHGQLCSDCPFTQKFKEKEKLEREKIKKEMNKKTRIA